MYWSCRPHSPAWSQIGQSTGWLIRCISSTCLTTCCTRGVVVWTTMPSRTVVLQAMVSFGRPSISTWHRRQTPATLRSGW